MNKTMNQHPSRKLNKKLILRKESIRLLNDQALDKVGGGGPRPTRDIECLSLPRGNCF